MSPSQIHSPPAAVFISYAHEDQPLALRLADDLQRAGHAVWIDRARLNYANDKWTELIAEGILNADVVVPLISPHAFGSDWVRDEINWAREQAKPFVPLLLADLSRDKAFLRLSSFLRVELFASGYDGALAELKNLLRLQPAAPLPAVPPSAARAAARLYLEGLKVQKFLRLSQEKYIALAGDAQAPAPLIEADTLFELTPLEHDRQRLAAPRRFADAVPVLCELRRAVLLGEPGSGKSSTLWKLAAKLAAEAEADPRAPLPLLVKLGEWERDDQPLPDFIAEKAGGLGAYLAGPDGWLAQRRVALLLDGLNELPAGQRGHKYPQVQGLLETHAELFAVITCRAEDYRLELDFDRLNRLTIAPLDPPRIHAFVTRYLPADGEALFWKLAGGDDVRALWEVWRQAGAPFELFWTADDIPRAQPNVFGVTTGEQDDRWRAQVRGAAARRSLLALAGNPFMLMMLTRVYHHRRVLPANRAALFQEFAAELLKREQRTHRFSDAEAQQLTDGLAQLAYAMQTRRTLSADDAAEDDAEDDADDEQPPGAQRDAGTVLPKAEALRYLSEAQLRLAGSASLLSLGEQVRFTHQLLQEYFAAQAMARAIGAGRLRAADLWPPARWWRRNNWEEATVFLAGLATQDCTPVLAWLAGAAPTVALECIARSGAVVPAATRERLRAAWLKRLTDHRGEPEPQARAALGRALAVAELDNRRGVGLRSDGLPDIAWVEIPGGAFQYGDAQAKYAAQPERLTLPAFWISRYPVTLAQYQAFLDAPDGYADARWFEGLKANDKDRRIEEQSFKFANHPRETVNWYQALAFCRWLSWRWGGGYDLQKVTDWAVRLPTEFEWEKAARGTDGRLYPYGNDFDAARGNVDETGLGQTSAVGCFPNGASPYGVEEMSGNVWEWCLSNYANPARVAKDEDLSTEESRVLRGGAWFHNFGLARAVARAHDHPGGRSDLIGFRLVVVSPPS